MSVSCWDCVWVWDSVSVCERGPVEEHGERKVLHPVIFILQNLWFSLFLPGRGGGLWLAQWHF